MKTLILKPRFDILTRHEIISKYSNQNTIDKDGIPKDTDGNSAIVFVNIVDYTKLMNQDEKKAIDLVHYKH